MLCQRGVSVTVVERDGVAAHASGMAAGVLNPLDGENIPGPLQPLALEGYRRHLEWWPRLRDETGLDVQGRQLPLLRVAFGDELESLAEMDAIEGIEPFTRQHVSPADIARLEPSISDRVAGGLVIEGIGSVDSHLLTLAISRAAQKMGARHVHDTVTGLEKTGDRGFIRDPRPAEPGVPVCRAGHGPVDVPCRAVAGASSPGLPAERRSPAHGNASSSC